MYPIFDLIDGLQVTFERVIEWLTDDRFQITNISARPIDGRAASTHAGVVSQFTLLQIRVSERILTREALVLRRRRGIDESGRRERRGVLTGSKTSIWVRRWTASCVA